MQQYLDFMRDIRDNGNRKMDRTGTGTVSVFGRQMRFDLTKGLPIVTTKRLHLKSIIHELLWFLKGETNIRYLKENGVSIWDEWVDKATAEYVDLTIDELKAAITKHQLADGSRWKSVVFEEHPGEESSWWAMEAVIGGNVREVHYTDIESLRELYTELIEEEPRRLVAGELGPVYGQQWINWEDIRVLDDKVKPAPEIPEGYEIVAIDDYQHGVTVIKRKINQIQQVIERLKTNPDCRRLIVSAWNVAKIQDMKLPPCHAFFQFYTRELSAEEILTRACTVRPLAMDYDGEDKPAYEAMVFEMAKEKGWPTRALSCQLYQRKSNCALAA